LKKEDTSTFTKCTAEGKFVEILSDTRNRTSWLVQWEGMVSSKIQILPAIVPITSRRSVITVAGKLFKTGKWISTVSLIQCQDKTSIRAQAW